VRQGYAAHVAGNLDQAEQCYQQILRLQPDHYDALYLLGTVAHARGDNQRALDLLRKAVVARPGEAAFHDALARASAAAGLRAEAISSYQAALAIDPDNAEVQNNLGCLFRDDGNAGKAIESFEAAIRVRPDLVEAHYNLANVLNERGDQRGAVGHFRAVLKARPDHAQTWNNLACSFQLLGSLEEAVDAFRRAVSADPGYGIGYKNLAGALRELGRLDEASQQYEHALRLLPQDPTVSHYLDALRQTNPERAPAAYVKEMFDVFAPNFEETLVRHLRYGVPPVMFQAVRGILGEPSPPLNVLDMGCGTGLFGAHARAISRELTGVDLSAEMIKKARARGCYDRLEQCDLLDFLAKAPPGSFDLAAAADVLIYFGNLSEIHGRVRTALKPGGLFAFSLEADLETDQDFRLRPTGRYCHARRYLDELARTHGFAQAHFSQIVIREEKKSGVEGYLCVLRKVTSEWQGPGPASSNQTGGEVACSMPASAG
jgi:predicted TPR repeat methyltransferase